MPNDSVMMIPYCSGLMPSCCATGSSSGARITMVTKLSSTAPMMTVMTITAGRKAAAPRLAIVAAIAVVTPSSVNAQEKIVAALTVKKIIPLSSEALVSTVQKLRRLDAAIEDTEHEPVEHRERRHLGRRADAADDAADQDDRHHQREDRAPPGAEDLRCAAHARWAATRQRSRGSGPAASGRPRPWPRGARRQ